MIERNGPGLIKTESRSPMMASGVATPTSARINITTVIAIPAIRPASKPAEKAFVLLIVVSILRGLERDAQERRRDARAREERSAQRSGNFRSAAGAKHDDFTFWRNSANSRHAGAAVSTRRDDNARTGFARAFRSSIIAAVIDDDDFIWNFRGATFVDNSGDWFLLVQRRNDNRNV